MSVKCNGGVYELPDLGGPNTATHLQTLVEEMERLRTMQPLVVVAPFVSPGNTDLSLAIRHQNVESVKMTNEEFQKYEETVKRVLMDPTTHIREIRQTKLPDGSSTLSVEAVTLAPTIPVPGSEEDPGESVKQQVSRMLLGAQMEAVYEWHLWGRTIPEISFPADWKVRIIPPFAGAVVRFVVTGKKENISVYLDGYNNLGFFGKRDMDSETFVKQVLKNEDQLPGGDNQPYWEIYPIDGDTHRCAMNDTDELISVIQTALNKQEEA